MLPSIDYLQAKNLRDPLILSRDIDDRKILQFDQMKGTTGYNQPKEIVLYATFP